MGHPMANKAFKSKKNTKKNRQQAKQERDFHNPKFENQGSSADIGLSEYDVQEIASGNGMSRVANRHRRI